MLNVSLAPFPPQLPLIPPGRTLIPRKAEFPHPLSLAVDVIRSASEKLVARALSWSKVLSIVRMLD